MTSRYSLVASAALLWILGYGIALQSPDPSRSIAAGTLWLLSGVLIAHYGATEGAA